MCMYVSRIMLLKFSSISIISFEVASNEIKRGVRLSSYHFYYSWEYVFVLNNLVYSFITFFKKQVKMLAKGVYILPTSFLNYIIEVN